MGERRPITGQDGTKRSRAERIVVCCMELFCATYPKQVVSLTKAKSVPTNMREFLSWAQRHYRIDVTASTVERKTGGLASAGICWRVLRWMQGDSHNGSNAHSIRLTCKVCGTVRREERHPIRHDKVQLHTLIDTWITGKATDTRERRIVSIVEPALILLRVRSSTLSRQHVQLTPNRNEESADRASRDNDDHETTNRSFDKDDAGTSLTVVRWRLRAVNDVQFFLDYVDRATVTSTAFVSFREQPMHFKDNQTLNLRVVDPIADEGVWAIDRRCV